MCGIFAALHQKLGLDTLKRFFDLIKHRGPDNSTFKVIDDNVTFGFHRLAIVDTSSNGNQPFEHDDIHLICNGEIFNHRIIEEEFDLNSKLKSKSDCECILHLYNSTGSIKTVVEHLDAEFAFVLYDVKKQVVHAARDPFGVRPLFIGFLDDQVYFASEGKAINFCDHVEQFKPGHYLSIDLSQPLHRDLTEQNYVQYYDFPTQITQYKRDEVLDCIRKLTIEAVIKRTMSDRVVGCFLSGGLDSSLVAAILHRQIPDLRLFSIGLKDSVDVTAARHVVHFLKADPKNHYIKTFTIEEGLDKLESVIIQLETYDVTTIRASTPQIILAEDVAKEGVVVVFSGEGSDELSNGYIYSRNAPNGMALLEDSKRLLCDVHKYDGKRVDRTTAKHGLEVRIPFLDKTLVSFMMTVDPEFRRSDVNIEKSLLRDAFKGWLPDEILYRPKEAFSDAVSSKEVSWRHSLQKKIDSVISDVEFENHTYTINPPQTKEALYYRKIFEEHYPGRENFIPYFWMPKWQKEGITDPSATVLECHSGDLKEHK